MTSPPLTPEALAHLTDRHHDDPDVRAVCREVLHLREQRDHLQTRCTSLMLAERAARGVLTLQWKRIGDHALPLPSKAHADDAGLDLAVVVEHALLGAGAYSWDSGPPERIAVTSHALIVFRTGFAVEIPAGWFGLIVVRSSIGKAGWDIESSGVIDANYRGEIMIPMVFRGESLSPARYVSHGQRMAQMLLVQVPRVECVEASELSSTARGEGGFGSTGRMAGQ